MVGRTIGRLAAVTLLALRTGGCSVVGGLLTRAPDAPRNDRAVRPFTPLVQGTGPGGRLRHRHNHVPTAPLRSADTGGGASNAAG